MNRKGKGHQHETWTRTNIIVQIGCRLRSQLSKLDFDDGGYYQQNVKWVVDTNKIMLADTSGLNFCGWFFLSFICIV